MSGRPQRKRNAQAPAPPPAIDPLHLLDPHLRFEELKKHTDKQFDHFNKVTNHNKDGTDRQEAEIKKLKEAVEKLTKMCTTVTGMYQAMAGELKECKEKVKVLEEGMAAKEVGNQNEDDGDDDDDGDDFRGGRDDGNGGGMDFDDVDLGGDRTNGNNDDGFDERQEDGPQQQEDDAGADEGMDQGNGEVEKSGGTEGPAPIGGGAEAMQDALMNRDQDPEDAVNRAAEPSSPDAHPGQPKAGVPKQKSFSLENLQHLLETGNILGLLESINENLAKLTPFFAGPGIREMSEVLSKLQGVEQKRIQGGKPAKRRKMDGELYNPENLLLSDDTVFYVRSFEQLYVVIMKRRQTIADLKKILEEKTGKNADNLRCFVGTHLLLDCYEIRESKIEDHCLVHVSEGNPDIPASSSSRQ